VDASGVKWRVRLKPAVQRSAPKTRTSRKAFSTNTPFCVRRACRFATPGDEVRLRERLNSNVHLEVNAPGTRPLGSFGPAIRTKNAHACFGFDRALQQGILANLIGISQGERLGFFGRLRSAATPSQRKLRFIHKWVVLPASGRLWWFENGTELSVSNTLGLSMSCAPVISLVHR
jgi:hypothetical protein